MQFRRENPECEITTFRYAWLIIFVLSDVLGQDIATGCGQN